MTEKWTFHVRNKRSFQSFQTDDPSVTLNKTDQLKMKIKTSMPARNVMSRQH